MSSFSLPFADRFTVFSTPLSPPLPLPLSLPFVDLPLPLSPPSSNTCPSTRVPQHLSQGAPIPDWLGLMAAAGLEEKELFNEVNHREQRNRQKRLAIPHESAVLSVLLCEIDFEIDSYSWGIAGARSARRAQGETLPPNPPTHAHTHARVQAHDAARCVHGILRSMCCGRLPAEPRRWTAPPRRRARHPPIHVSSPRSPAARRLCASDPCPLSCRRWRRC